MRVAYSYLHLLKVQIVLNSKTKSFRSCHQAEIFRIMRQNEKDKMNLSTAEEKHEQ